LTCEEGRVTITANWEPFKLVLERPEKEQRKMNVSKAYLSMSNGKVFFYLPEDT
jgi:hypothetical protein